MNYIYHGDKQLFYKVLKNKRKSILIAVHPKGFLVIKTPLSFDEKKADKIVLNNLNWILKKILKNERLVQDYGFSRQFEKSMFFLGKEYQILFEEGKGRLPIFRDDKILFFISANEDFAFVKNKFLKQEAKRIFSERLSICKKFFNLDEVDIKISFRKMKRRYGSCYPERAEIKLNFYLVFFDISLIDAVILHELCHFFHKNHKKGFYALLHSVLPQYAELDLKLKAAYRSLVLCGEIDNSL